MSVMVMHSPATDSSEAEISTNLVLSEVRLQGWKFLRLNLSLGFVYKSIVSYIKSIFSIIDFSPLRMAAFYVTLLKIPVFFAPNTSKIKKRNLRSSSSNRTANELSVYLIQGEKIYLSLLPKHWGQNVLLAE